MAELLSFEDITFIKLTAVLVLSLINQTDALSEIQNSDNLHSRLCSENETSLEVNGLLSWLNRVSKSTSTLPPMPYNGPGVFKAIKQLIDKVVPNARITVPSSGLTSVDEIFNTMTLIQLPITFEEIFAFQLILGPVLQSQLSGLNAPFRLSTEGSTFEEKTFFQLSQAEWSTLEERMATIQGYIGEALDREFLLVLALSYDDQGDAILQGPGPMASLECVRSAATKQLPSVKDAKHAILLVLVILLSPPFGTAAEGDIRLHFYDGLNAL